MLEFACRSCGTLVSARSMDQIFEWEKVCKRCSKRKYKKCVHCKVEFRAGRPERYCSPECRHAHKEVE